MNFLSQSYLFSFIKRNHRKSTYLNLKFHLCFFIWINNKFNLSMNKVVIFFITLMAYMSRVGLIGSYAAVKYSISKDLQVGEAFLGNHYLIQDFWMLASFLQGFSASSIFSWLPWRNPIICILQLHHFCSWFVYQSWAPLNMWVHSRKYSWF